MKTGRLIQCVASLIGISALNACGVVREAQIENERKCDGTEEIRRDLESMDMEYFRSWSDADFNRAEQRLEKCSTAWGSDKTARASELSRLREVHATVEGERIAKKAAWNIELERQAQCARTSEYRLFKAQDNIRTITESNDWVESQLAHEREVAAVSGVIDLQAQRALGEMLVRNRTRLVAAWDEYKKAGGTARALNQVKPISNPCKAVTVK